MTNPDSALGSLTSGPPESLGDNPLDILRWYAIHGSDEKIRISAAGKLAEYEFHKKKALDDNEIEDSAVIIRMNLDFDVKDNDKLRSVEDGQEVPQ